ncbi:MAG: hypothetical protein IJ642_01480 [Oscillospiraceae bacterium]|nr:hypothetical protein [Oscillospiraceae bacterium]
MEHAVDGSLILRFGLKCFGVFALIFIAAVFTPKMAEYIDKWKSRHRPETFKKKKTGEKYTVRSIYELPPEPEEKPEIVKKKAVVRKKDKK